MRVLSLSTEGQTPDPLLVDANRFVMDFELRAAGTGHETDFRHVRQVADFPDERSYYFPSLSTKRYSSISSISAPYGPTVETLPVRIMYPRRAVLRRSS